VKTKLETRRPVDGTPPAPSQAAPATEAFAAYRLSVYGALVVTHHVTGLVTDVPAGNVPAPPLQPVNDAAVRVVHVTVPEEPNEIVFVPELNLPVAVTGTVELGSVTLPLSVVAGDDGQ
jgi:hypothetical protein